MSRRPRAVTYSPVTRRFRELFATHAEAERRKLPVDEIAGERQERAAALARSRELEREQDEERRLTRRRLLVEAGAAGALVAGFGVFTVVFGVSHNVIVAMISLLIVGACDMVSVIVRHTLVQLGTPDEMRGRVSAVNMIFIGASNEVGQFESGITAQWLGTVPAVVAGGVGTLAIVALWAWMFPSLRRVDQLSESRP